MPRFSDICASAEKLTLTRMSENNGHVIMALCVAPATIFVTDHQSGNEKLLTVCFGMHSRTNKRTTLRSLG